MSGHLRPFQFKVTMSYFCTHLFELAAALFGMTKFHPWWQVISLLSATKKRDFDLVPVSDVLGIKSQVRAWSGWFQ